MFNQVLQKYRRFFEEYEQAFYDFAYAIDALASGRLTHKIIEPQTLDLYLQAMKHDLMKTAPNYELVFKHLYQYYGHELVTFTNNADKLLIQIPVFIKLKHQKPMFLYSMDTAPVPLDAETYAGDNHQYTKIILETKYIALTEHNYIPLSQEQLNLCHKIGSTYFCENAHLLRHRDEHICASAIYYRANSKVIANNCTTRVYFKDPPKAKVLDAGDQILLSNLPKPMDIGLSTDE